jgi:poly(3-hydroxybutyrate) depolymerase
MQRGPVPFCLRVSVGVVSLLCVAGCAPERPAAPVAQAVPLKEQMRTLPAEPGVPYIRNVLVCGPFWPLPAASASAGSQPATGSGEIDFLAQMGGESAARPTAGAIVRRPDGSQAVWTAREFPTENIDLGPDMPKELPKPAFAYVFARVPWPKNSPALLYIRSRSGLKVYCNGKPVPGAASVKHSAKTGLYLPVDLVAGDNALLVRVDGSDGRWMLAMRVVGRWYPSASTSAPMAPLVKTAADRKDVLEIVTDTSPLPREAPVEVSVWAPAGKVVTTHQVRRGERIQVNVADWPEGPYEVRLVCPGPDGRTQVRYVPWYRGDWQKQIRAMLDEYDTLPADSDDPIVLRKRMLCERALLVLGGDIRKGPPGRSAGMSNLFGALMEHRELGEPQTAFSGAGGFCRLAWRDEVDGSPQFARLFTPYNYDPNRAYPLVVFLHGRNGSNPPYVNWGDQNARHSTWGDRFDVLWLEPHGRGNTGYRGFGEADVMRAVALARQHFKVDDDRIYLTGQSMGGGGAWYVGTRHTDVFAAIAPVFGGWDYRAETSEADYTRMSPLRRLLMDQVSSFAQAECLLHTPVFVNHGDVDPTVSVENSRYAVRMLQRWGYDVRYWEHPGRGHESLGQEWEMLRWLLAHRREANPRQVRLRAPFLDGANAHWVHAEQQENPFLPMVVDAFVEDDHTIRLTSQNVLQLRLDPGRELIDTRQPIQVVWNEELVEKPQITPDGQIILRAEGYVPGPRVKKATGPTPFAIVVGTISPDPRMRRYVELAARKARDGWEQWQHVSPRYFKDTEITDEQIRAYSLILFGGPAENAVTARLIKDIPLTIAPDCITIDGQAFRVRDAAVAVNYPHPLNADRFVRVIAGTSAAGFFQAGGLSDEVDFHIDDGKVGEDNDEVTVAWGRFDHNWHYDERYVHRGDPSARAKAATNKAPSVLSLAIKDRRVMLSDVLEDAAVGAFGEMRRDLNWLSQPITVGGTTYAAGLGVEARREPSTVTYELAGGNWKHLRAILGIEMDKPAAQLTDAQKRDTVVFFTVRGDGRELYRSPEVGWNTPPIQLDVDVSGVNRLELEVTTPGARHYAASCVNWAQARLEK